MFSPLLYRGCGVLSKGFGGRGLPWELLCADDLVLLANLEEDLRRLEDWIGAGSWVGVWRGRGSWGVELVSGGCTVDSRGCP